MSLPSVSPDHPKIPLLFCLDDRIDDIAVEKMRRLVEELADAREWTIAPPDFVDETEESENPEYDDIRTVGGVIDLYSGFPPWGDRLPIEVDRAQLADVKFIVEKLAKLSAELQSEIAFEYNDESIGWIERGVPDRSITEGWIGEWERAIAARRS
jgi:hypothetical protein